MHRLRNIQGSEVFDHSHLGPGYAAVRVTKGRGGLWNGRGWIVLCLMVFAAVLLAFAVVRSSFA